MRCVVFCMLATLALGASIWSEERIQRFDNDPKWEGHNNRVREKPRAVKQDFGYSKSNTLGGKAGAIGGWITAAAEPAYYAKKLNAKTLNDPLSASGRLIVKSRQCHLLVGFFNSKTVNEWRTANSIAIRILGRSERFFAYVEYATSQWRAGGDTPGGFALEKEADTGRMNLRGFPAQVVLQWSLRYDPNGNNGAGSIVVTIGKETSICHLDKGHKADGATFDRFGMLPVLKSADDGGEVWLDDLTIGGRKEDLSSDPMWDGHNNRRAYETKNVRPWFNFGYSPTNFCGGTTPGELGGLVFRGDCRHANKLASYGDRLSALSLDKPLKASGKVALRRAVSDSTTLLGFYHSTDSLQVNRSQSSGIPRSFLGVAVEGPSREGFLFYPIYRTRGDGQGYASADKAPHILPDGKVHDWSLEYDPAANTGRGRIVVRFDRQSVALDLPENDRKSSTQFDRFGLVTTWIDGNGQQVYFDELKYTHRQ